MKLSVHVILCAVVLCSRSHGQGSDDCASAQPIAGTGVFNYDSTAATTDGAGDLLCYKFGTSQIESDVWFAWTAPADDTYTISTCGLGATNDTKIALYDGVDCVASPMLACNDDALSGQCGLESEITVPGLTASSIYLIRIGSFPGKPGGTGQFDIEAFMPPDVPRNDDCIDAEVLPDCGSYAYDNLLATEDGLSDATCLELGSPKIIRDVWYSFTPQSSGTHFFSTCGGTVLDTKIAVYRDTGVCPPTEIIDCDDDVECIIQVGPSIVSWTAIAGTAYLLRLGSSPGADGGIGAFDVLGCGPPVIGTSYCTSTPNSTGFAATIEATGSSSVSANDLVLTANAAPNAPGIGLFLAGPAPGQAPLFDGVLCIDFSGLQRINQVSPVVNNTVTQAIDYTGVSTGTEPLNVVVGSSYFYQHWFRDPGAGGSGANFTNGVEIAHGP